MKIIEQSHEIISFPHNGLKLIEQAGRTCYKSENKIGCTHLAFAIDCPIKTGNTSCQYHSSNKFVKMILAQGHHAMLEFGDITVRFITNRGVTHELVRHRLCSFAQESTRYVRYNGHMEFIRPIWIAPKVLGVYNSNEPILLKNTPEDKFIQNCLQTEFDYNWFIDHKWRPEQAREVLPNSLKTEIIVKANLREWRHIFTLRTSKKAHPQIRALMLSLLTNLKTKIPVIFDDIGDKNNE